MVDSYHFSFHFFSYCVILFVVVVWPTEHAFYRSIYARFYLQIFSFVCFPVEMFCRHCITLVDAARIYYSLRYGYFIKIYPELLIFIFFFGFVLFVVVVLLVVIFSCCGLTFFDSNVLTTGRDFLFCFFTTSSLMIDYLLYFLLCTF